MNKTASTTAPAHVLPIRHQIQNLRRIHSDQGSKNTVKSVEALVRERCYKPGIDKKEALLFGYKLDSYGYTHVGSGEDDDPFIIGLRSVMVFENSLVYATSEQFSIFHADATFKLSDIGYPIITGGLTDIARSYQIAVLFVWLSSRCWSWQAFRSPGGYDATNNPCKVYNASIKSLMQRRKFHMHRLLLKLSDLVEIAEVQKPVPRDYVTAPSTELKQAADVLLRTCYWG
ncbi:hypothetical protein ON010_g16061 [Phytophthora cinnamomi]|nr:hypothetical protein ON010_g16061 [Phytophthora cinnamomi]